MQRILQLLLLFCFSASSTVRAADTNAPITVKLSLSTNSCEKGCELIAQCEVTTLIDKPYMIVWIKKYPPSTSRHGYQDDVNNEVEIGSNHHVNSEFKNTGRYTGAYKFLNGKFRVLFTLTIKDVRSEDSGYIGCRIPPDSTDDRIQAFQPFTVRAPIQSVLWTSVSVTGPPVSTVYSQDQTVNFLEDEKIEMSCEINGSYPQPVVKILLGNNTDITSYFTVTSHLKKGPGVVGLQPIYYRVMATNRSFFIDYDYNQMPLKCIAVLPGDDVTQSVEGSVMIHISKHKPKFLCDRRVEVRFNDGEPFNITCTVRAQPLPQRLLFSWNNSIDFAQNEAPSLHDDDDENEHRIRHGGHDEMNKNRIRTVGTVSASALVDRDDKYNIIVVKNSTAKYRMSTEVLNDTDTLMIFTINPASLQHVGLYTFSAENELGRVEHTIELEQEPLPNRYSSGSRNNFTLLSLLACIIVTLSSYSKL